MKKHPAEIRRDYGDKALDDSIKNPFELFSSWLDEAILSNILDATAMVLATVDENHHPDTRVILLKGIEDGKFLFYSDYDSRKGKQIATNPNAALNFYWPNLSRQIRVRGTLEKTSQAQSTHYFATRPKGSQIAATLYPQSSMINNREELESAFQKQENNAAQSTIKCPDHWGGYYLTPIEFEFFQGRDNRLHDRLRYTKQNHTWAKVRLSP